MLIPTLDDRIDAVYTQMVTHRRHLHRNPEVSFHEFETTRYICEILEQLGLEVHRPLETGCVAVLRGELEGPVTGLRADIDALPIQEEGEHKEVFLSTIPGVAHCCGHDVHTANLLGVATILAGMKEKVRGTVVLIFQPGEEKLPGGGFLLTQTGILQKLGVQEIYGLHTHPGYPAGEIAVKEGPLMASTNEISMRLTGKGGHAASPHETVDPVLMASHIITQLQSVVSRNVRPTEPAVVSVTSIHGGTAFNIIPETVELKGTVRAFSKELTDLLEARIRAIVEQTATAFGGKGELFFERGYPAVVNAAPTTKRLVAIAESTLGSENVHQLTDPIMAGEDFAFYQQQFPGTFFFLGSGGEATGSVWTWHHPRYNADEACMKTGMKLMVQLVTAD